MRSSLFLACMLALAPVTLGKNKNIQGSPEVPQAKPKPVASSITLNVRQSSSGRSTGTFTKSSGGVRAATEHSVGIEITVANFGAQPENVTVQWFFVGRSEKSGNWFRTGDGEKTVTLAPRKTEPPFFAAGEFEDRHSMHRVSHAKSGGHLLGWVVTAHNAKGELVAVRTSDSYLDGFAAEPPKEKKG